MLCSNCKKNPANFHYKYNHNGETAEINLCTECAKKLGYLSNDSFSFELNDMLTNFFTFPAIKTKTAHEVYCKTCGESYEEFRKTGKFGCPDCYGAFSDSLDLVLGNIQSSLTHKGKIPGDRGEEIMKSKKIAELKKKLQQCILDEKYEKAAELRDEIKSLEESRGDA